MNFTAEDLARTRFAAGPAPLVETVTLITELRRRPRRGFLTAAAAAFPAAARPLLDVITPDGLRVAFLEQPAASEDEGYEAIRGTPRRVLRSEFESVWECSENGPSGRPATWVRNMADGDQESIEILIGALDAAYRVCVLPLWDRVSAAFNADLPGRMSLFAAGGPAALFGSLHPSLRWRDSGLDRPGLTWETGLYGDGLILVPSAFRTGPPVIVVSPESVGNMLIYPAAVPGPGHPAGELAALLGRTRAAALQALHVPHSTMELATRLGISTPAASEHARVLRDARLIQTVRNGKAVQHSLTPLGRSLLSGH